jgi:mRNA-degrading endonuclease RelE of RelBE toxin-antitoxin system
MVRVEITPEAQSQFLDVPHGMQDRILAVFERLAAWPKVSGAKPLRRELKGSFRIRAGDWRILFRPQGETILIFRIDNRRDVYER